MVWYVGGGVAINKSVLVEHMIVDKGSWSRNCMIISCNDHAIL